MQPLGGSVGKSDCRNDPFLHYFNPSLLFFLPLKTHSLTSLQQNRFLAAPSLRAAQSLVKRWKEAPRGEKESKGGLRVPSPASNAPWWSDRDSPRCMHHPGDPCSSAKPAPSRCACSWHRETLTFSCVKDALLCVSGFIAMPQLTPSMAKLLCKGCH